MSRELLTKGFWGNSQVQSEQLAITGRARSSWNGTRKGSADCNTKPQMVHDKSAQGQLICQATKQARLSSGKLPALPAHGIYVRLYEVAV